MIHAKLLRKIIISTPIVLITLFLIGCSGYATHSIDRSVMELNTDRPGSDINTIPLDKAKPQLCSDACHLDGNCLAWTYVKPGILDANAHCRIKSQIPSPKRSSCCISGLK